MVKLRVVRKWVDGVPFFNEKPVEMSERSVGHLLDPRRGNPFSFAEWEVAKRKGESYAGKYILESEFQTDAIRFGFMEAKKEEPKEVETVETEETEKPKRKRRTKAEIEAFKTK